MNVHAAELSHMHLVHSCCHVRMEQTAGHMQLRTYAV